MIGHSSGMCVIITANFFIKWGLSWQCIISSPQCRFQDWDLSSVYPHPKFSVYPHSFSVSSPLIFVWNLTNLSCSTWWSLLSWRRTCKFSADKKCTSTKTSYNPDVGNRTSSTRECPARQPNLWEISLTVTPGTVSGLTYRQSLQHSTCLPSQPGRWVSSCRSLPLSTLAPCFASPVKSPRLCLEISKLNCDEKLLIVLLTFCQTQLICLMMNYCNLSELITAISQNLLCDRAWVMTNSSTPARLRTVLQRTRYKQF